MELWRFAVTMAAMCDATKHLTGAGLHDNAVGQKSRKVHECISAGKEVSH
jgi:hypothetical protein